MESAATLVHAFVTSRIDYCNVLLAEAPKATTDKLVLSTSAYSALEVLHIMRYINLLTYLLTI